VPGALDTEVNGIDGPNIVGTYSNGGQNYGFIYNGTTYKTLSVPGSAGFGTYAYGISGSTIVGYYQDANGVYHGYVATPAPVPIPGDFSSPADCDVDGSDLATLIANPSSLDVTTFVQNFGRNACQ